MKQTNTKSYFIKLLNIFSKKKSSQLLAISILISLMEFLSVFTLYPLFYYLENGNIIDNGLYANIASTLSEFLSVGSFETILLISVIVLIFTQSMVFYRNLAKSKIKEEIMRGNRQHVLNVVFNTTISDFLKVDPNRIESYLGIESERLSQIILSFTNLISSIIVILLMTIYLLYLDIKLFLYLIFIGFLLFFLLKRVYRISKEAGINLSMINDRYIKYIKKVLNDKTFFMLSDDFVIKKSFNVEVIRELYLCKYEMQKYSSLVEFIIKTSTMVSILLIVYFFYKIGTEVSLILFSAVVFVRLLPFLNQFGNALQNLKINIPVIDKLIFIEDKLKRSDFIDLDKIELDKISISESGLRTLNIDINNEFVELFPGNLYGIFGKSGSGKTTLSESILGLNCYKDTKILLNGQFLLSHKDTRLVLRNSNYMSQNIIPNEFNMTDLFSQFDQNLTASLFERFGFFQYKDKLFLERRLKSFSGGEQQKINFIYVILQQKKVVIFDEPTSSMDDDTLNLILDILDEYILKYRAIVILISHNQIIKNRVKKVISLEQKL
jgi:ABC-type multidrug transport system fused ATPase/permease subunit